MFGIGPMELGIWVILFGGALTTPAMGAPLPLDPVLSAIAPEECLWYAATAGMGPVDASSSNQTEQLLAEPQVQRFLNEVESQVTAPCAASAAPTASSASWGPKRPSSSRRCSRAPSPFTSKTCSRRAKAAP